MPTVFQLLKSILVTSIQTTSVPLIIHIKTVLMPHSYWRKLFAWLFACLDCQCSLSTVFSPRPSSTDTIPPHDKPTMLNLQTLSDWNFPLQMLRASITSWSGNTKSDRGTCAHSSVPWTTDQGKFCTTQGSYCAGAGAGAAKMGKFEHRLIHNKCHRVWKVMITLVILQTVKTSTPDWKDHAS